MMFDVILPTIGRKYLPDAIDSVIAQSFHAWKLLIVFDRAYVDTDTIQQMRDDYKDPRINWCNLYPGETVNNWNGTDARNFAIDSSDSPWIAYIDDDDRWMPNHLEIFVEMAKSGCNMLHTRGAMIQYRRIHSRSSRKERRRVSEHDDKTTVGMAHTRELFKKTPGWQAMENHDCQLWADMISAGGQSTLSNEITYEFLR